MDAIREGWFGELNSLWPGQCMSLKVEKVLHHEKSKYQDIMILETKTYGRVLVLDGIIQCTERDEFSYQEMITLLPVNSHPSPRNVLVIGGGDGGVVRELSKHPAVESITMCEIDDRVIDLSRQYLPYMAKGFESPKLKLNIEDGFQFMKKHTREFDVIITDSSDPIGPAECLYEKEYYALMKNALKPGGIVCTQGECLWLHIDLIKKMQDFCQEIYPVVDYAYCTIPTYPSGQIGFTLCSLNPDTNFRKPVLTYSEEEEDQMGWRYYSKEIHSAAFVLPKFARKVLKKPTLEDGEINNVNQTS